MSSRDEALTPDELEAVRVKTLEAQRALERAEQFRRREFAKFRRRARRRHGDVLFTLAKMHQLVLELRTELRMRDDETKHLILRLLSRHSDREKARGNDEAMYALNRAWHAIHNNEHVDVDATDARELANH